MFYTILLHALCALIFLSQGKKETLTLNISGRHFVLSKSEANELINDSQAVSFKDYWMRTDYRIEIGDNLVNQQSFFKGMYANEILELFGEPDFKGCEYLLEGRIKKFPEAARLQFFFNKEGKLIAINAMNP